VRLWAGGGNDVIPLVMNIEVILVLELIKYHVSNSFCDAGFVEIVEFI